MGDIDLHSSNAAYTLGKLKTDDWQNFNGNNTSTGYPMNQQIPPYMSQRAASEEKGKPFGEIQVQRVFINRDVPERFHCFESNNSDIRRLGKEDAGDSRGIVGAEEEDSKDDEYNGIEGGPIPEIPLHDNNNNNNAYQSSDIIFSNGNNREKRRLELFEKYSDLYRFKEDHRLKLYTHQKRKLNSQLKDLSQPKEDNIKDWDLNEHYRDLSEKTDYELTKVKVLRNHRRVENLKNYYTETSKVYQQAYNALNIKLESLKGYLTKQRSLLINLDRDFTEIGSSRSGKFYSGFNTDNSETVDNEDQNEKTVTNEDTAKSDSSETDTGGTSSSAAQRRSNKKNKNKITKKEKEILNANNQLLSSILTGFAPLLTDKEFQVITSEDFKTRYNVSNGPSVLPSSTVEDGFSSGGGASATTTSAGPKKRGPRVRNTDKDTTIMNKIMKGYTAPDDLNPNDVEDDLTFLRKLRRK